MKILLLSIMTLLSSPIFAQLPPMIVHGSEIAIENLEARALEASIDDMEQLFYCNFSRAGTQYKLKFHTSGQEDIVTSLHTGRATYSPYGSSTYYYKTATNHDYSSQNYEIFVNSLIVDFLDKGESSLSIDFNSEDSKWSADSTLKNLDIEIRLNAKSEKRSLAGQCLAGIGCYIYDGGDLISQSWRYMNDAEDFSSWSARIGLSGATSMLSVTLAALYDESLTGKIIIGATSHNLSCSDSFLPHYIK